MGKRKKRKPKRTSSEKIMIVLGILISISMVVTSFAYLLIQ